MVLWKIIVRIFVIVENFCYLCRLWWFIMEKIYIGRLESGNADAVAQRSLLSYHLVSDSPFKFLVGDIVKVRIKNDMTK